MVIKYDVKGKPTEIKTALSLDQLPFIFHNLGFLPAPLKPLISFCFRFASFSKEQLSDLAGALGSISSSTGVQKLSLLTQQGLGPDYG